MIVDSKLNFPIKKPLIQKRAKHEKRLKGGSRLIKSLMKDKTPNCHKSQLQLSTFMFVNEDKDSVGRDYKAFIQRSNTKKGAPENNLSKMKPSGIQSS